MSNNPTSVFITATGTVGSVDSKLSKYRNKDGDDGVRFSFSVALFSHFFDTQDKKSVKSDNPLWVRVTLWGEDARKAIESIHKRDAVTVSGMMRRTQPYTNNNGDEVDFAFEMSQNPTVALVVDAAHTASQEWALDDEDKGSRSSRRSRRNDDDEDEAPRRSSRRSSRRDDDEDEEEERPRKRRNSRRDDEDEDDESTSRRSSRRSASRDEDDEEEERPRKRRSRAAEDEDEDDDDLDFIKKFKGSNVL